MIGSPVRYNLGRSGIAVGPGDCGVQMPSAVRGVRSLEGEAAAAESPLTDLVNSDDDRGTRFGGSAIMFSRPGHRLRSFDTSLAFVLLLASISFAAVNIQIPSSTEADLRCRENFATVNWSAPSAGTSCTGLVFSCSGVHQESGTPWSAPMVNGGGDFPAGTSEFCCNATDDCGGVDTKCWTLLVHNRTKMLVEPQPSPSVVDSFFGFQRCIRFEVFQDCVQAPKVVDAEIPLARTCPICILSTPVVYIPGSVKPVCITARDPWHTLRSCYMVTPLDCDESGIQHANFQGDPFFNGNWLVGGNLDGWRPNTRLCNGGALDGHICATDFDCPDGFCDNSTLASIDVIDITDAGSLISEWLSSYDSDGDTIADGNMTCSPFNQNHADINGDGLVDLLDFSFVIMNFLDNSKDCCCPGSLASTTTPRTEITVEEARRGHRPDLVAADINGDGLINQVDLAALLRGERPKRVERNNSTERPNIKRADPATR